MHISSVCMDTVASKNMETNHCAKGKVCIRSNDKFEKKEPEVEGTDSTQLTSVIGLGLSIPILIALHSRDINENS